MINEVVNKLRKFALKATGNSMRPILKQNDILYFKKLSNYKIGDLIVFKRKGKLISHRLVYKNKNIFITKGDNLVNHDGKINKKKILGKVYALKRKKIIIDIESLYLIQSTIYFNEIRLIQKIFNENKINFVFIKGLINELAYFNESPKRIFADTDMLIDKRHIQEAVNIFKKLNYKRTKSDILKKNENELTEISFFKEKNGCIIVFDLHSIINWFSPQVGILENLYTYKYLNSFSKEILKTKKFIKINKVSFPILERKRMFIYLCLHLFHHNLKGYHRYKNLEKLCKNLDKKDIQFIKKTIQKYRLENFIYPVIVILNEFYNTKISINQIFPKKPQNKYIDFLIKKVKENYNFLNSEKRIEAGLNRFINILMISDASVLTKLVTLKKIKVLKLILWSIKKTLKKYVQNKYRNN